MKSTILSTTRFLAAGIVLVWPVCVYASSQPPVPSSLEDQVRHALLKLPYNGVFDNLQFSVDGSTVSLSGQAHNYIVQRDAVNTIKHLEGVSAVKDQIEVLPLSPFDDTIRRQLFRSIYRDSALNRYQLIRVQPPIRIIVNNGNVTLTGVVDSEMDRNVIYDRAREVRNVFSVTNNLRVQ
jgi:hyperosmotically inducible protein